ncbi:MAG: hypothetical protein GEV28_38330 [Actinophytocola sp.]|uniref:hypothetical protein n=1 Tax=Actinophytocola sp. TaxID=1872138 RepID=UPI001329B550|nr:hypothetical protein [Actinophytocola sp.]MPZ85923.1 hypothetical protein [Actinophytocola sp.]
MADPFLAPFIETVRAGTRFVPATPAWTKIDAHAVPSIAAQQVATGRLVVEVATAAATTGLNAAFAE